jgi:hypothetical protein
MGAARNAPVKLKESDDFKDKAAHDECQKAERHLKFIEENQANWKKVRVFDSYVEL